MRVHLLTTALHHRYDVAGVEDVIDLPDAIGADLIAQDIAREAAQPAVEPPLVVEPPAAVEAPRAGKKK